MPAFRNNIQKLVFNGMRKEVQRSNTTVDQKENRFYKRADPNAIRIQTPSYSVTYVH